MLNKDQNQDVGAGGVAIQAGGNVVVGLSVAEARAIALDVAKLTFHELAGAAKETMSHRVEEITEKVISRLAKDFPAGLAKAVEPDFQYALYTVQKEYGRTGDEALGDLLVDLLIDRSKQDERNILQIVLNESLAVAPKLTSAQIAVISIIFLFRYTTNFLLVNHDRLGEHLDTYVLPLVGQLVKNRATFQHLEFTGCGTSQLGTVSLEELLIHNYLGLFSKGIDPEALNAAALPVELGGFFIPSMNEQGKYQISAMNEDVLKQMFDMHYVGEEFREKISGLQSTTKMNAEEARAICVKLRPYMDEVFSAWNDSDMKNFTLTSVGLSIGHANIKRIVGSDFADLAIWVN